MSKIDQTERWLKWCWDKYQYKKKTEKERFGIFWKYKWEKMPVGRRRQIAVPYCPNQKCRVRLEINDRCLFCSECDKNYIPHDEKGIISIAEATNRMTKIFETKEDLI